MRYLVKVYYRVNGKNYNRVIGVESRTVKQAKQDGVNEVFNSLTDDQRKSFGVNKLDHVRFKEHLL